MTIEPQNIVTLVVATIAILISGKMAYNQWKAKVMGKFFQDGANQAVRTIMARAKSGKEFKLGDDQTGENISLIKVNKKKDKKDKKKK